MRTMVVISFAIAGLPVGVPAYGQTDQVFEPPRRPPPTDMSIPAATQPNAAKPGPVAPRSLPPPKQPVVGAALPPSNLLEMMVRSVLIAVNQANFTGNYSVLHALGTREMQTKMKPEDLSKSFAILRKKGVDLTTVLSYPVRFSLPPAVGKDGILQLVGTIPSKPHQIDFSIVYFPVAGFWRIDALTVAAVSSAAEAGVMPPSGAGRTSSPKPAGTGQ